MTELRDWARPHLRTGGYAPRLFFKVHGAFGEALTLDSRRYGSTGAPEGCTLTLHRRGDPGDALAIGTDGWLGSLLREKGPDIERAVLDAPTCLVLRGEVKDASTLNYLRDAVGLMMATLDQGGVAVFDAMAFRWSTRDEWRPLLDSHGPEVGRHVEVLVSDEEQDASLRWLHTRGMLKFGRPDLSVHDVRPEQLDKAVSMVRRFIAWQALGHVVEDGAQIKIEGLPPWRCANCGDLSDPDFNNRHLSIGPVTPEDTESLGSA